MVRDRISTWGNWIARFSLKPRQFANLVNEGWNGIRNWLFATTNRRRQASALYDNKPRFAQSMPETAVPIYEIRSILKPSSSNSVPRPLSDAFHDRLHCLCRCFAIRCVYGPIVAEKGFW